MAFNFPDGAINGETHTASNGVVYRYNGTAWLVDSPTTTSNFDSRYLNVDGDSVVSGSSQLTASLDERYTLSGSISTIPIGTISGSSQISEFGFVSGSYETTGRGIVSGSIQISYPDLSDIPSGIISGSSQLESTFPSKFIGSWTVPSGASTKSFTVDWNHTYVMWVRGNIPNGIISWNATVNVTNSNVPIIGTQYGWYYVDGNALVLTSIPSQIVGTSGSIITTAVGGTENNTFAFGITNNSGTDQTIYYGYIKIS